MYGIIKVVERNLMDYSENPVTMIDIDETKLLYADHDIEQFNKTLAELLNHQQYNKLLIFEIPDKIEIKLIGYKQALTFPHFQIVKPVYDRNMISQIIYHKPQDQDLMMKTLYAIKGMLSYLTMIDTVKGWSKKQLKEEFMKLGYRKTVWYRSKRDLRESYLEKYFYQMLLRV